MWPVVVLPKANPALGRPVPMDHMSFRSILEELAGNAVPVLVHPGWRRDFPWLLQGTTASGVPGEEGGRESFDFRLFHAGPKEEAPRIVAGAPERWERLAGALHMPRIVHSRQVHGCAVHCHDPRAGEMAQAGETAPKAPFSDMAPPQGQDQPRTRLTVVGDGDGHVTSTPGTLLTVTVADCVPISLVDPRTRSVGLLHGGWRGVAERVLEEGVRALAQRYGSLTQDLHLHMGPAICGTCYEVGPEVHGALGLQVPEHPAPVDLRALLGEQAVALGVPTPQITLSAHCTRCGGSPLFSHRGGDGGRQLGLLGVRGGG
jgi:YfiH family protein